jgi:hypothetical protein
MTVTYDTVPIPAEYPSEDTPPSTRSGLICEVCDNAIEWAGRGRKPKRCKECRTGGASKTANSQRSPRGLKALEENLAIQLYSLGAAVAMFDKFDGTVIAKNSVETAEALTAVAANDPKLRRLLEGGVKGVDYVRLTLALSKIALPIMAHHGWLKSVPDPAVMMQQPVTDDGGNRGHDPI